ncbi:MAG: DUF481 domain-containing protein [Bacteroidia bacterium]
MKPKEPLDLPIIKDSTNKVISKQSNLNSNSPDTVFLKNGDKITGRIISLEQGRLKIDAQGPGMVNIKWHKISTINGGNRLYKVEDLHGVRYIGLIQSSTDTGKIMVVNEHRYELMIEDILRIFPLEEEWYLGFKGSLGGGVSYTKSSDVLTSNAEYNLYYVISKWRFRNNFSFISTKTTDETSSLRIETNFQALYALPHKWVLSEINSFNRNDELGIKSRISFGLGGGNNIVQTDRQRLLILTGIIHNSEKNIESNDAVSNFEWPVTIQHTVYSFMRPDLTSAIYLASYVGITEKGRYRFDANADITWEFITDVKLQVSVYYNFDNKAVEGKTSEQDYGTILSLIVDLK